MDKEEIKNLVSKEVDKALKSQFDGAVAAAMRKNGSNSKREVVNVVRNGMVELFKFMWNKRTTWGNDIKGGH